MSEYERLVEIVDTLRGENGCPWDKEQTHGTLKRTCMEEAAEVIAGINILEQTGDSDNLKEELGDLLLQVIMHARIAKEEGLFDMEDVCKTISDKMVRRHPHVFSDVTVNDSGEVLRNWEDIKKFEKKDSKIPVNDYLFSAFDESKELIDLAAKRKREKLKLNEK